MDGWGSGQLGGFCIALNASEMMENQRWNGFTEELNDEYKPPRILHSQEKHTGSRRSLVLAGGGNLIWVRFKENFQNLQIRCLEKCATSSKLPVLGQPASTVQESPHSHLCLKMDWRYEAVLIQQVLQLLTNPIALESHYTAL